MRVHSLMKRSIKNSNLRYIRQEGFHCINTFQVRGIMKRSKLNTFFHFFDYFISNQYTCVEFFTTMNNAVTNSVYLIKTF